MEKILWIAGLVIAAPLASAEPQLSDYQYGDQLDIAKVLSLTIPVGGCEVVEATMTYLDSKGETRVMRYLRQGSGCHDF